MRLVQLTLYMCLSGLWFILSVSLGRLVFKTGSFVFQLRSKMHDVCCAHLFNMARLKWSTLVSNSKLGKFFRLFDALVDKE